MTSSPATWTAALATAAANGHSMVVWMDDAAGKMASCQHCRAAGRSCGQLRDLNYSFGPVGSALEKRCPTARR